MKIQTKIVLIVFSLVLVVGVVTTIVSQTVSKNIVKQQIYNHLETTAQSRAHHIETFLETEREVIKQLSESIVIERFLSANKGDRDYIQKFNDVMRRLEHTARVREYDHGLFVLDKSGTIVASSEETDIGKDRSGDPYFLGGRQGTFVKDAYFSRDRKVKSLAFSAPVLDENNEFLGVVVMRSSIEGLNEITTDRTGLGETGEIYLVNKDGYMITPSRFVDDTFLKRKVDTENARSCLAHEHKEHIRRKAVTLFKDYRGVEVLGAHAFIEEMNWCLLAEMDEKEALAPIARITHTMLSILALLSILGGILSILISRTITKPIVKLHEGTEEIEKGNLDHKVGTRAKDEIGQLSRAFDSMTANLKKSKEKLEEYSKGLEKKVEERTRQLEEKVEESEKQRVATFNLLQDVNQAKNELEKTKEELEVYSTKLVEVNESLKTEITERKRAEKIQSMLFRISQAASGSSNLEELLEIVHQQLGTLIDTTNFYVALYNPENDLYSFPYCVDQYDKAQNHTHQQLRKSLTDYVRRTGVPLLADEDIHQQLIQKGEVELVGTPSQLWLGAPLKTADGVIGVVVVQSYTDSSCYSATDLELMTFVSENIASVIERKRTEEALQASQKKYRTLIEVAQEGIGLTDIHENFTYVNQALADILDYSKEELVGLNLEQLCDKEQFRAIRNETEKRRQGKLSRYEAELYTKTGERKYFTVAATPLYDENGEFTGTLGLLNDITERKRAEELLRTSEAQLSNAMKIAQLGYWEYDVADDLFTFNDHLYAIFRTSAEQVGGYKMSPARYAQTFLHPDDMSVVANEMKKALETTDPNFSRQLEHRIIYADGEIGYISVRYFIIKDNQGRTIKTYGANQDITERKRAEDDKDRLLHDLSERMKELNCLYEIARIVAIPNISLEEILQTTVDVMPPAWRYPNTTCAKIKVEGQEFETSNYKATKWKQSADIKIYGKKTGVVELCYLEQKPESDEGPFLKEERNLINAIAERVGKVTERKRAEIKLKQSLAELQRSNAELQHFAYIASHDLQEPLRMVVSYVQLLERRYKGKMGAEADDFITYAVDGAIRMQKLINDLLAYSRVGTRGKDFEPTNCQSVVDQALANLHVTVEENSAQIKCDPLPTVMADATQLAQLFQNFIGNAIKFRGEDPPHVHISAEQKENEWEFSVSDNGIGIAKEFFGRIFEVFQRLHTRKEHPGTGIGLTVCKKIVERHGGRIWVESEPGRGSTFHFTIPERVRKEVYSYA